MGAASAHAASSRRPSSLSGPLARVARAAGGTAATVCTAGAAPAGRAVASKAQRIVTMMLSSTGAASPIGPSLTACRAARGFRRLAETAASPRGGRRNRLLEARDYPALEDGVNVPTLVGLLARARPVGLSCSGPKKSGSGSRPAWLATTLGLCVPRGRWKEGDDVQGRQEGHPDLRRVHARHDEPPGVRRSTRAHCRRIGGRDGLAADPAERLRAGGGRRRERRAAGHRPRRVRSGGGPGSAAISRGSRADEAPRRRSSSTRTAASTRTSRTWPAASPSTVSSRSRPTCSRRLAARRPTRTRRAR